MIVAVTKYRNTVYDILTGINFIISSSRWTQTKLILIVRWHCLMTLSWPNDNQTNKLILLARNLISVLSQQIRPLRRKNPWTTALFTHITQCCNVLTSQRLKLRLQLSVAESQLPLDYHTTCYHPLCPCSSSALGTMQVQQILEWNLLDLFWDKKVMFIQNTNLQCPKLPQRQ